MTRKSVLATLGIVGACGVCCAALLFPVLAGAGGAALIGGGWAFGLSLDAILCGVLPAMLLAGAGLWYWRRRRAASRTCGCAGSCDVSSCGGATANS